MAVPDSHAAEVLAWHGDRDAFMLKDPRSPFRGEEFGGFEYFDVDPAFRVQASVSRGAGASVSLLTSTGGRQEYAEFGDATFDLLGERCVLQLYAQVTAPDGPRLFVPFVDETAGMLTYGAGRYLEATLPVGWEPSLTVVLDFNYAYLPLCAHLPRFACPLPPERNRLPVRVLAGERLPAPTRPPALAVASSE